jgi:arylformamidase
MRILDVSLPLSPTLPVWPGDPPIEITRTLATADGGIANVSRLRLGTHSGTHVDPPFHFIDGGATMDAIPIERWIGAARVVEIADPAAVTRRELESKNLSGAKKLLFKTRNSELWNDPSHAFRTDFVAVDLDAAKYIVELGIDLVGIDYFSIEKYDAEPGHPVHHTLLVAGVLVIEALDLREAREGDYTLYCLPLRIVGGDGAPARVILIEK